MRSVLVCLCLLLVIGCGPKAPSRQELLQSYNAEREALDRMARDLAAHNAKFEEFRTSVMDTYKLAGQIRTEEKQKEALALIKKNSDEMYPKFEAGRTDLEEQVTAQRDRVGEAKKRLDAIP